MLTATIRDDSGECVGGPILTDKVFTSGKVGYHGQGKLSFAGRRYQAQAQLVDLGPVDEERDALVDVEARAGVPEARAERKVRDASTS